MAEAVLSIFDQFVADHNKKQDETITLEEFLDRCKTDPSTYANPWERLLKAIGEPEIIDYAKEPHLRTIFEGLAVPRYPGFADFYGVEGPVDQIVSFIRKAAQGNEQSKQILYLLGPVGGGKSSMAQRLMDLMEQEPFYMIDGSPVFDDPLVLFNRSQHGAMLKEAYGIDPRYLGGTLSPWAVKKLQEVGGDIRKLKIKKVYPSASRQIALSRVEAQDKNNQDTSSLVGKVDISKLDEGMGQHDQAAYGYAGGLNRANRGMMEFVEMFKAPITALNPLLAATQDGKYNGTEPIGSLPFKGIILAHSNESEWGKFKNDPTNEAFIDRVCIIKVPYTLRLTAEINIYEKYRNASQLATKPCAPGTVDMLAKFAVMTRLAKPTDGSSLKTKMEVYDGRKPTDAKAQTLKTYRDQVYTAGIPEGMDGWSVRASFKLLADTFDLHAAEGEISASPIDLMFLLERAVKAQDFEAKTRDAYLDILANVLKKDYAKDVDKELKAALLESYSSYGQNVFERYFKYAELSLDAEDEVIDPETKYVIDKKAIEKELVEVEKPAGISNAQGFRSELVRFVTRYQRDHNNMMPDWKEFKQFADAIEARIFDKTKDLMPLISFGPKGSEEETEKHDSFVRRMVDRGYTQRQVGQLVKWYELNRA